MFQEDSIHRIFRIGGDGLEESHSIQPGGNDENTDLGNIGHSLEKNDTNARYYNYIVCHLNVERTLKTASLDHQWPLMRRT